MSHLPSFRGLYDEPDGPAPEAPLPSKGHRSISGVECSRFKVTRK